MSGAGAFGQGSFFERLLGDLVQMMGSAGTGTGPRMEMARTFAHNVAAGTNPEPNVDPSERIRIEELARVAEMHIADVTGLSVATSGSIEVVAFGPGMWAWQTVEDWQFLLGAMSPEQLPGQAAAGGASPGNLGFGQPGSDLAGLDLTGFGEDSEEDLLGKVMQTMGPMLSAMQVGSAVGHLARTTMGTYELPIPRLNPSKLLFIPSNISKFADDWGLQLDEVRLWISLRELTMQAILARTFVAERMKTLITSFLQGASQDAAGFAGLLGGIDPSDPEALRGLFEDPSALLEVEVSPERQHVAREISAITAAMLGYVEHVLDTAGSRLLGDRTVLSEAWRRNLVDNKPQISGTEAFLGIDVGAAQVDRGTSFVKGVVDREGEQGLGRLWESAATLPTPSEVDAPGLWLERLKLQDPEESAEPEEGSGPGQGPS
ncbi:MAG: zinc-dependent metalloprotease [Acidimicrobiales bacterium]